MPGCRRFVRVRRPCVRACGVRTCVLAGEHTFHIPKVGGGGAPLSSKAALISADPRRPVLTHVPQYRKGARTAKRTGVRRVLSPPRRRAARCDAARAPAAPGSPSHAPRQRARPAPPDCGRAGILEGQNLGLEKGRELGHELGFYAGCAECWCACGGGRECSAGAGTWLRAGRQWSACTRVSPRQPAPCCLPLPRAISLLSH